MLILSDECDIISPTLLCLSEQSICAYWVENFGSWRKIWKSTIFFQMLKPFDKI